MRRLRKLIGFGSGDIVFLRRRTPTETKPVKVDNTFRDKRIVEMYRGGMTQGKIAEHFGITRPRVVQIVKAHRDCQT